MYIALSLPLSPPCYLFSTCHPPSLLPFPHSNVLPLSSHCYLFFLSFLFTLTLSLSHQESHTRGPQMVFVMHNHIDQYFVIISMVFLYCPFCIFASSQASLVPFLFGCLLIVSFSSSALSLFPFLLFYFIFIFPFISHTSLFIIKSRSYISLPLARDRGKTYETSGEKNARKQRETWIDREKDKNIERNRWRESEFEREKWQRGWKREREKKKKKNIDR